MTSRDPRAARTPAWRALHFLAIGAALFALWQSPSPVLAPASGGAPAREPIVISAAEVAAMRAELARHTGRAPTAVEVTALVDAAVERELLYREALARGLDRDDRSVRYRLEEKMRFVSGDAHADADALYRDALAVGLDRGDPVIRRMLEEKMRLIASAGAAPPDDAALAAYFDRHRTRYRQPARTTMQHVFLSASRRGEDFDCAAAAIARRLRAEGVAPDAAAALGDRFPLGHRFAHASEQQLGKSFGTEFAKIVSGLPVQTWSEPIASPYGVHLVWVEAREPERMPPLDAVRGRVLRDYREADRADRVGALLAELRARYEVRVETGTPPT